MTPQNKLYEAVNTVIEIHEKESEDVFYLHHMDKAITELKKAKAAYEQEQPEAINEADTDKLIKPVVINVFADNGEHSHWALINPETGIKLWSEDPEECKAMGHPVKQPEAIAGENENGHLGKNTSIFSDKIYDSISSQQTSAYEQEQPEAIAGEKTIEETDAHKYAEHRWMQSQGEFSFRDFMEGVDFASQQTSAKDKEIAELEDALLDIIQVNEWKEKYGEDERYLQALPVALKNAKKLIQKQCKLPTHAKKRWGGL